MIFAKDGSGDFTTAQEENKAEIPWENGKLKISENKRFLEHENGAPFFWLGDTGWLLFSKLDRMEAESYLEDRREKEFNVVQVMALHDVAETNVYGKLALINKNIASPNTYVNDNNLGEYNFWEHMDYIVDKAAQKGIYLAMVPVWGSIVKAGYADKNSIKAYGEWLANRYKERNNIIWIIGGDINGEDNKELWITLAETIKKISPDQLMTFHPLGRTQSSSWFHNEKWLDFNMVQSGHRRYDQIMKKEDEGEKNISIGQDNWRYIENDYSKKPPKPTIDGEPSYEGIPQGLHDPLQPYWTDDDCRRYAYWSVFAGAFGYTYGHSAVMQMHKQDSGKGSYGVRKFWQEAINDPGAGQMKYLKQLMLAVPFFERVPDQTIINRDVGSRYERLIATRGKDYIFVYNYKGRIFSINMGKISGDSVKANWYSPRDGSIHFIGCFENSGIKEFTPPGKCEEGNDWVLVVTDNAINYI